MFAFIEICHLCTKRRVLIEVMKNEQLRIFKINITVTWSIGNFSRILKVPDFQGSQKSFFSDKYET